MDFAFVAKNVIFVLFLLLETAVLTGLAPDALWILGMRAALIGACLSLVTAGLWRCRPRSASFPAAAPVSPEAITTTATPLPAADADASEPALSRDRAPAEAEGHELALLYHEIRNCTSTLKGNAILLKQNLPSNADLAPVERIERVAASIERIAREVMDLAEPAPQESPRSVRLDSLVRECVQDYFPGRQGAFRVECPPSLPVLEGDAGKLRQALVNVLRNSLEAEAGEVVLRAACRGESLTLSVEDDGIGCEPAELARIFQPRHTTKKGSGGLGMGLAMVKSCVEAHGGAVWASPRAGGRRGLVLHMAFPVRSMVPARLPVTREEGMLQGVA